MNTLKQTELKPLDRFLRGFSVDLDNPHTQEKKSQIMAKYRAWRRQKRQAKNIANHGERMKICTFARDQERKNQMIFIPHGFLGNIPRI